MKMLERKHSIDYSLLLEAVAAQTVSGVGFRLLGRRALGSARPAPDSALKAGLCAPLAPDATWST
eukprot:scaffold7028_cov243-Pinguiococcus_pyrenoidosus.AAC.1